MKITFIHRDFFIIDIITNYLSFFCTFLGNNILYFIVIFIIIIF